MYQWELADDIVNEDDNEFILEEAQNQSVFLDSEWTETEWDDSDNQIAAVDDLPLLSDKVGEEASHELLTKEQEIAIAQNLQHAFGKLQASLAQNEHHLEQLYQQVVNEDYQNDLRGFDNFITLYDTLLVYAELQQQNPRFITEYQQVKTRLADILVQLTIDRDSVLNIAEATQQSTQADYAKQIKQRLDALYSIRNQLVGANIRLVYHVARRHMDKGMTFEDMVQEGVLGLLRAALKFDANVGVRFSTYSFWWIKQSIRQAITKQRSLIRYPTHINDQVNKVYGVVQEQLRQTGHKPSMKKIKAETGFPIKKIKDLLELTNYCVSASAPLYDDGEKTLLDELKYDDQDTPEQAIHLQQEQRLLQDMLATLNQREQTILRLKFGIGHRKPYSLNEIAPQIGVSRERVRQIIEEAMEKIRYHFEKEDTGLSE